MSHLGREAGERIHEGDGEIVLQVIGITLKARVGHSPDGTPQQDLDIGKTCICFLSRKGAVTRLSLCFSRHTLER